MDDLVFYAKAKAFKARATSSRSRNLALRPRVNIPGTYIAGSQRQPGVVLPTSPPCVSWLCKLVCYDSYQPDELLWSEAELWQCLKGGARESISLLVVLFSSIMYINRGKPRFQSWGPIPWSRVLLLFYRKKLDRSTQLHRVHNHTVFINKLCKMLRGPCKF